MSCPFPTENNQFFNTLGFPTKAETLAPPLPVALADQLSPDAKVAHPQLVVTHFTTLANRVPIKKKSEKSVANRISVKSKVKGKKKKFLARCNNKIREISGKTKNCPTCNLFCGPCGLVPAS